MEVLTKHVPLKPSKYDPMGIHSHLVAIGFRFFPEDAVNGQIPEAFTLHCVLSKADKSISQITDDSAAQLALTEILRSAPMSLPKANPE